MDLDKSTLITFGCQRVNLEASFRSPHTDNLASCSRKGKSRSEGTCTPLQKGRRHIN